MATDPNGPLLDVAHLSTAFHTRAGVVRAVRDLSFTLGPGETLGIVGESGSGKSVAMYSLLGLLPVPPGRIEEGTARFGGVDLLQASPAELRRIRGKRISMIFQDPMTALNPYMTVGAQLAEPLRIHERISRRGARARAAEALRQVGIQDGAARLSMYPHQFSGGMRQRVMIAMALITRPEILIADEPTTALDVTVQAQILELIDLLKEETGTAVILITHDLGVIAGHCSRVLVLYAGQAVEEAEAGPLFAKPRHPYTRALLDALPATRGPGETLYTIPGLPPDLARLPQGCAFAPRCTHATDDCTAAEPELAPISPEHTTRCLRQQRGEI